MPCFFLFFLRYFSSVTRFFSHFLPCYKSNKNLFPFKGREQSIQQEITKPVEIMAAYSKQKTTPFLHELKNQISPLLSKGSKYKLSKILNFFSYSIPFISIVVLSLLPTNLTLRYASFVAIMLFHFPTYETQCYDALLCSLLPLTYLLQFFHPPFR